MTTIHSQKVELTKSAKTIFDFLADANNHQQLMPSTIYNWTSTKDECSFTIQNMAKLELMISERLADSEIKIIPKGKAPFALDLKWVIESTGDKCTAQLTINADLNPFIKMMATGPLTELVNYQANKLKSISELVG